LADLSFTSTDAALNFKKRGHTIVSVRLPGSRLEALGRKMESLLVQCCGETNSSPGDTPVNWPALSPSIGLMVVHAHHKDDLPLVALTKSTSKRPFQLVFTRQMPLTHKKKDPYHRWLYTKIDLFITITELLKRDHLEKLPLPFRSCSAALLRRPVSSAERRSFPKTVPDYFPTRRLYYPASLAGWNIKKGQHLVIDALKKNSLVRRFRQGSTSSGMCCGRNP